MLEYNQDLIILKLYYIVHSSVYYFSAPLIRTGRSLNILLKLFIVSIIV